MINSTMHDCDPLYFETFKKGVKTLFFVQKIISLQKLIYKKICLYSKVSIAAIYSFFLLLEELFIIEFYSKQFIYFSSIPLIYY